MLALAMPAAAGPNEARLETRGIQALAPGEDPRVHLLDFENGAFTVNGKPASLVESSKRDKLAVDTLILPEEPGILVHVIHGALELSMERYRRKLSNLKPLSDAGAAPRLISAGSSPIPGLGLARVYAQERVQGRALNEFPAESMPMDKIDALFDGLNRQGLKVEVPLQNSRQWLLSHVRVGKTLSAPSEERAYFVGGEIERDAASGAPRMRPDDPKLKAHYAKLRALMLPAAPLTQALLSAQNAVAQLNALFKETDAEKAREESLALSAALDAEVSALLLPMLRAALRNFDAYLKKPFSIIDAPALDITSRYSLLAELYGKAIANAPDHADMEDSRLILSILTGQDHRQTFGRYPDKSGLSMLTKFAGAGEALASRRPDLLPFEAYAQACTDLLSKIAVFTRVQNRARPKIAHDLAPFVKTLNDGLRRASTGTPKP